MQKRWLSAQWLMRGIICLSVGMIFLLGYLATHYRIQQLTATTEFQQNKLQQQRIYQQRLAAPLTAPVLTVEFTWQLADWAEKLNLSLTLQPHQRDDHVLTAVIQGAGSSIQQLLQLVQHYSAQHKWQRPWRSQLLNWQQQANGEYKLSWQLTAHSDKPVLKATEQRMTLPPEYCQTQPPLPLAKQFPPLTSLTLTAIVNQRPQTPMSYWKTHQGDYIRATTNDQFAKPLTVITAISSHAVELTRWQYSGDCWLQQQFTVSLKQQDKL